MLRDRLADLLALLAPDCCASCGDRRAGPLCDDCQAGLPWQVGPGRCALCGAGLPRSDGGADRCLACLERASTLDACVAAVAFEEPVVSWIHDFKYARASALGRDPIALAIVCELILAAAASAPGPLPELVVPVPLHVRRLRERGFNQSALLARAVARQLGARLDCRALARIRDTEPQTRLGRRERARNLRGAFRYRRAGATPTRVWLVDDVTTTGATLESAAAALRAAGVRHVTGVCVARRLDA